MLNELTLNDVGPETVWITGIGLVPISPYSSDFRSDPATASAVPPASVPSTSAAMDQRRRPAPRTACRTTVGKPVMVVFLRGSRVSRKQCALTDTKSTTAPRVTTFTDPRDGGRPSCLHLLDGVEPAKVGRRP